MICSTGGWRGAQRWSCCPRCKIELPGRLMRSITIRAFVFTLLAVAVLAGWPSPAAADPPSTSEEDAIYAKANAESWGTPDPAAFVRLLKSAVARHDAMATALLVRFPLRLIGEKGAVTRLNNTR